MVHSRPDRTKNTKAGWFVLPVVIALLFGAYSLFQTFRTPSFPNKMTADGVTVLYLGPNVPESMLPAYADAFVPEKTLPEKLGLQRPGLIFFEIVNANLDTPPTCVLSFDGQIVEPVMSILGRNRVWIVAYGERAFPKRPKSVKFGLAHGPPDPDLTQTVALPEPSSASQAPAWLTSQWTQGQAQLTLPITFTDWTHDRTVLAFDSEESSLDPCGYITGLFYRSYCFSADPEEVASLKIEQRKITWIEMK